MLPLCTTVLHFRELRCLFIRACFARLVKATCLFPLVLCVRNTARREQSIENDSRRPNLSFPVLLLPLVERIGPRRMGGLGVLSADLALRRSYVHAKRRPKLANGDSTFSFHSSERHIVPSHFCSSIPSPLCASLVYITNELCSCGTCSISVPRGVKFACFRVLNARRVRVLPRLTPPFPLAGPTLVVRRVHVRRAV